MLVQNLFIGKGVNIISLYKGKPYIIKKVIVLISTVLKL